MLRLIAHKQSAILWLPPFLLHVATQFRKLLPKQQKEGAFIMPPLWKKEELKTHPLLSAEQEYGHHFPWRRAR